MEGTYWISWSNSTIRLLNAPTFLTNASQPYVADIVSNSLEQVEINTMAWSARS